MIKVTVALTFVLLVLYKMFFVHNQKLVNNKWVENFINKFYVPIIVTLFGLTFATSFFKLGEIPHGINIDEAASIYTAWSISETGIDRYLNHFPVYFRSFGGGQSVLYGYMVVFLFKIFGFSIWAARLPLAIVRMAMTYCTYSIIKKEKNKIKDVLVLFLMAIVPYFIMQSRWGLDCNMMVGIMTIAIFFLLKAVDKKRYGYYVLAGLFFGLTAYTYAVAWMIVPFFLAVICCYLLWTNKIKIPQILAMGAVALVVAFPMVLFLLVNNKIIEPIEGFITIPRLTNYRGSTIKLSNIYDSTDIFKMVFGYDRLEYNAFSAFGTIYYMNIIFCISGIVISTKKMYSCLKTKKYSLDNVMYIWFFSVMLCQLVTFEPNINRANAVFVPLVYFTAIGIYELTKKVKLMIIPIIVLLLINFSMFSGFYFVEYEHNKDESLFPTYYLSALEYADSFDKDDVYIFNPGVTEIHIFSNFMHFVDPTKFGREIVEFEKDGETRTHTFVFELNKSPIFEDEIDEDIVYLMHNDFELGDKLEAEGFKEKTFGYISVFTYENETVN